MSNGDDFFDDLLGGAQPGVQGVLRDLRRLADRPAPRPGADLAAFLAATPTPVGRLTPLRLRITRLGARVASMGAAGAIVLGGGAVAMACVGAVTVARVTSEDPKPPASVSTLLPTRSDASKPAGSGATGTAATDADGTAAQTTQPAKSPEPTESAGHQQSGANHLDGQGQDDQRADVHSGGTVDHRSDAWRQGLRQGFGQGLRQGLGQGFGGSNQGNGGQQGGGQGGGGH